MLSILEQAEGPASKILNEAPARKYLVFIVISFLALSSDQALLLNYEQRACHDRVNRDHKN
jgi:hypothetical protein